MIIEESIRPVSIVQDGKPILIRKAAWETLRLKDQIRLLQILKKIASERKW